MNIIKFFEYYIGSLQSGKLSVINSGSKYFNEETF